MLLCDGSSRLLIGVRLSQVYYHVYRVPGNDYECYSGRRRKKMQFIFITVAMVIRDKCEKCMDVLCAKKNGGVQILKCTVI